MSKVITDYIPIACGFHDRLEHWAVRSETVEIVWLEGAAERTTLASIADVFAKDGADWLKLGSGEVIRADHLVSVGGIPRPNSG